MAAVWMHLRAVSRSSRFATLGLILLVGLAGGIVLSAAAGARRTETAFPRLLVASRGSDALVSPNATGTHGFYAMVARLPQVEAHGAEAACMAFARPGHTSQKDYFPGVAAMDDNLLYRVDRPKLFAGRLPRPDRAEEALANKRLADVAHLSAGSRLDLSAIPASLQAGSSSPPPQVRLTIVGIGVFPGEVVPSTELDSFPTLYLTPAYFRGHQDQVGCEGLSVRLRPGASVDRFRIEMNEIAASRKDETGGEIFFQNQRDRNAKVTRAIRPQAVALWLFAILTGVTFLVVVGQILARQASLSASANPILRGLGMTQRQLFLGPVLQTGIICFGGGVLAVAIAIVSSPLMPIGPARVAEPSPGLSMNSSLLAIGFAGVVVLLLSVTLMPIWRAASGAARERDAGVSRLVATVAKAGLPVPTGIGIRTALHPGRGRSAVPVRSALAGAVIAVAAAMSAVIFGANLDRLVTTPRLYGWRWDAIFDTGFGLISKADVARIGGDPAVSVLAGGHYGSGNVTVDGRAVPAVGLDLLRGNGFPRLVEGRPPRTTAEVALGVKVAKRLDARLGSTVHVAGLGGSPASRDMRVVGIAVFPALGHGSFEPTGLGEGVAFTARALSGEGNEATDAYTFVILGFAPGTDVKAAVARLQKKFNHLELCSTQLCEIQTSLRKPADISNFARVRGTPLALAGAFAFLAAATLGHTLVTSVRRRRRDLAVMKTIGFVRRQVSATVAWQAVTVAVMALVFGLPIGVAAGRWAWRTFADQLGVPLDPHVPLVPTLLAIPVTIVVANLIAAFPARTAGRTRPAIALRAE